MPVLESPKWWTDSMPGPAASFRRAGWESPNRPVTPDHSFTFLQAVFRLVTG